MLYIIALPKVICWALIFIPIRIRFPSGKTLHVLLFVEVVIHYLHALVTYSIQICHYSTIRHIIIWLT
jgi:hypothetical protein